MQPAMKNLMTKVSGSTTVEEGAAFWAHGIAAALKRAGTDEVKLENLRIDLDQNSNAWAGAVAANTTSAENTGEPGVVLAVASNGLTVARTPPALPPSSIKVTNRAAKAAKAPPAIAKSAKAAPSAPPAIAQVSLPKGRASKAA